MDPITLGLLLAGAGTAVNTGANVLNRRSQNKETSRRTGIVEPYLMEMLGGSPGQAFNTGQDALLQMLRSNPLESSDRAMQGMVETGNPFDMTELFRSLGVMDQRSREGALADVRSGASGLGQRFGTAMARESNNAMSQLLDSAAARNAQIAMGSHDAAQGRRLGAAGQLNQNLMTRMGLAQGAMGSDQARQQQQMQALSLLLGLPMGQSAMTGVGSDVGSFGNLLAFMEMMKRSQNT